MDLGTTLGVVGVLISAPALIMSISPFSQMMWGRPKLKFEFVEFTGTDGKNLICSIQNEAISNNFLRLIGVHRDSGEVNASFSVFEQGTGRILAASISALINDATARQMALVVTSRPHFHVGFPIIHCTKDGPIVFDPRQQESILIPIGIYRVQILVVCGDRSHIIEKLMNVHNDQVRTYWI